MWFYRLVPFNRIRKSTVVQSLKDNHHFASIRRNALREQYSKDAKNNCFLLQTCNRIPIPPPEISSDDQLPFACSSANH